ncbi:hypothetical protein TPA0905_50540 [Streptomyces olivaceus]|nr:hypothetical protein TPA0905_50540 [Streptomyces olivaceus]
MGAAATSAAAATAATAQAGRLDRIRDSRTAMAAPSSPLITKSSFLLTLSHMKCHHATAVTASECATRPHR